MTLGDCFLALVIAAIVIAVIVCLVVCIAMLTDKEDYLSEWWSRGTHQGRYKRDDDKD